MTNDRKVKGPHATRKTQFDYVCHRSVTIGGSFVKNITYNRDVITERPKSYLPRSAYPTEQRNSDEAAASCPACRCWSARGSCWPVSRSSSPRSPRSGTLLLSGDHRRRRMSWPRSNPMSSPRGLRMRPEWNASQPKTFASEKSRWGGRRAPFQKYVTLFFRNISPHHVTFLLI